MIQLSFYKINNQEPVAPPSASELGSLGSFPLLSYLPVPSYRPGAVSLGPVILEINLLEFIILKRLHLQIVEACFGSRASMRLTYATFIAG